MITLMTLFRFPYNKRKGSWGKDALRPTGAHPLDGHLNLWFPSRFPRNKKGRGPGEPTVPQLYVKTLYMNLKCQLPTLK